MIFSAAASRALAAQYRTFGVPATLDGIDCTVILSRTPVTGPAGYDTRVYVLTVTAVVRVGDGAGLLPSAPVAGALLVVGAEQWRVTQPPERTGEAGEYRLVLA